MTGPEHYRRGETWLELAEAAQNQAQFEMAATLAAVAQSHFAAALAAATAMAGNSLPPTDAIAWSAACGTHAAQLKTGTWEEKTDGDR